MLGILKKEATSPWYIPAIAGSLAPMKISASHYMPASRTTNWRSLVLLERIIVREFALSYQLPQTGDATEPHAEQVQSSRIALYSS